MLFANALAAFGIAFYWQARVIFTLFRATNWDGSLAPWKDLAKPNGVNNTFGRFVAGEIFPELRQKWLKAIGYVVVSFLTLFLVAVVFHIFGPGYLS
jgi:hypothetical protein